MFVDTGDAPLCKDCLAADVVGKSGRGIAMDSGHGVFFLDTYLVFLSALISALSSADKLSRLCLRCSRVF